jgi:hypothetical protein
MLHLLGGLNRAEIRAYDLGHGVLLCCGRRTMISLSPHDTDADQLCLEIASKGDDGTYQILSPRCRSLFPHLARCEGMLVGELYVGHPMTIETSGVADLNSELSVV